MLCTRCADGITYGNAGRLPFRLQTALLPVWLRLVGHLNARIDGRGGSAFDHWASACGTGAPIWQALMHEMRRAQHVCRAPDMLCRSSGGSAPIHGHPAAHGYHQREPSGKSGGYQLLSSPGGNLVDALDAPLHALPGAQSYVSRDEAILCCSSGSICESYLSQYHRVR